VGQIAFAMVAHLQVLMAQALTVTWDRFLVVFRVFAQFCPTCKLLILKGFEGLKGGGTRLWDAPYSVKRIRGARLRLSQWQELTQVVESVGRGVAGHRHVTGSGTRPPVRPPQRLRHRRRPAIRVARVGQKEAREGVTGECGDDGWHARRAPPAPSPATAGRESRPRKCQTGVGHRGGDRSRGKTS